MKYTSERLAELHRELKAVVKEVQSGKLTQSQAAERILQIREEMDKVIQRLRADNG